MIMILSNSLSTSSLASAGDVAAKTYRNAFIVYFAWLIAGALITAFLTWWLWHAGNNLQDAMQRDTELKIVEATGKREINREVFVTALLGQPKAPVQILYLRDDQESLEFAQEIENMLVRAKWSVTSREPIPAPTKSAAQDIPITMTVGGQPSGVTVVTDSVSEAEADAATNRMSGKDWVKTPWTVLEYAFEQSMGESKAGTNSTVPKGTLRVVVAPKPIK